MYEEDLTPEEVATMNAQMATWYEKEEHCRKPKANPEFDWMIVGLITLAITFIVLLVSR